MQGRITKLTVAGATCYAVWGCLHLMAGYNVYLVGVPLEPSMVKGRVFQDAWNLFFRRNGDQRRTDLEHPQQQVGVLD